MSRRRGREIDGALRHNRDRRLFDMRRRVEAGEYDAVPPTLPQIVDGILADLMRDGGPCLDPPYIALSAGPADGDQPDDRPT